MTYSEVIKNGNICLLPEITKLYGLKGYEIEPINPHEYGRNVAYTCKKEGTRALIIRVSYQGDRSKEHLLGEVEFVRYLFENGSRVSDVVNSLNGNLLEEIVYENHSYFVILFKRAKGKTLGENNYQYREDAEITEYFYNCGKTLGKIHELSKSYKPNNYRYSFFDKYTAEYINELLPNSLSQVKKKLVDILEEAKKLDMGSDSFGLIHFDYNEGNYHIDFETADITVFDFDNSCYCWYMFDLAGLWKQGVGWIQFEKDADKRENFMDRYFETILDGYRSETNLNEAMLGKLQFFIQLCYLENIVDALEVQRNNNQKLECEEWLSYNIKCLMDDIPYHGFFHEIYSTESPFEIEKIEL